MTPLHCATRSGHDQIVDLLIAKGADVSNKTKNGLTPLHMAAQGDHVECAKIMLINKAPIDEVTVVCRPLKGYQQEMGNGKDIRESN